MALKNLCVAFAALTASPLFGRPTLTSFTMNSMNPLSEQEISFSFSEAGQERLAVTVPLNKFPADQWVTQGLFAIDWSHCQPKDMQMGIARLDQCLRRASLRLNGKEAAVTSGRLVIQALADQSLDVSYLPNKGFPGTPLHFLASPSTSPEWTNFANKAKSLARRALPFSNNTGRYDIAPAEKHLSKSGGASTHLLLFGDSGTGTQDQYRIGQSISSFCQTERCDFSILLGDNFYNFGVSNPADVQFQSKFEKPYANVKTEFRATLGNHDHLGNIQAQIDYSSRSAKWRMPARYYTYTEGETQFYVIDSDDFGADQVNWLTTQLTASKALWNIVYGHHPVYSYGEHGDTAPLQKSLLPILKKFKVDFYIAGHDHDKQLIERDGIVFPISGASAKLRSTKKGQYPLFAASTLGFAHLGIEGNSATIRFMNANNQVEFTKTYQKNTVTSQKPTDSARSAN